MTLGPRAGFALLLAVLVGFELLFIAEATEGAGALETERSLREVRAMEALDDELRGALDVAEARLEAMETLPLVEDDGLLLVRDGAQYFPRLPGAAGDAVTSTGDAAAAFRALDSIDAARTGLRALQQGEPVSPGDAAWNPVLAEVLRQQSIHPVVRVGLLRSVLAFAPDEFMGEPAQSLVLRAWPWLEKKTAARACVEVQRRGDERGLKTERFAAACQRGLHSQPVAVVAAPKPRLVGEWLMVQRAGEVRGVKLELAERLADVQKTLLERGMLEQGEQVSALPAPRGESLMGLRLVSPRLETAHAALRTAMWWKTVLLGLTLLLGLGVVLLARLAERRKDETLGLQREFIATEGSSSDVSKVTRASSSKPVQWTAFMIHEIQSACSTVPPRPMKTPVNLQVLRVFAPILIVVGVLGFVLPPAASLTSGAAPYNIFHLVFGVIGLGCVFSGKLGAVRAFNLGFGLIDLYQAVASLTDLWPRSLFVWTRVDDALHVVVGTLLVGVALGADRVRLSQG